MSYYEYIAQTYRTQEVLHKIKQMGAYPLDVLLVGATGVGKSSTINALFGREVAKVGTGSDPETMNMDCYLIGESKLRFWDSPGLGDSPSQDLIHAQKLTDLLYKTYTHDDGTWGFIDLVMVVLDGASRDLGTTYYLLENIICRLIDSDRIMVVINQCDMAMKGRYWDCDFHRPESRLEDFLDEKAESVQTRIYDNAGCFIRRPVYYSATENYHLDELMDLLIEHIPLFKRSIPY